MKEQVNASIVVKDLGLFMGYKVFATLWSDSEFKPLVETSQWTFSKKKAHRVAQRYVMAMDAIKQIQEALRAGI